MGARDRRHRRAAAAVHRHGRAAALDPLRAAGGQRAGEVVRAARRPGRRRRDDGRRAGAPAATTPSGCSPPPGVTVHRNGRHVTVAGTDELDARRASSSPATRRRRRSRSPPACSCRGSRLVAARACGVNWTRTRLRADRSSAWAAIVIGDLEDEPGDEVAGRRADRATSTSPHGPLVGTTVEAEEVPLAIDELPLVALLGCFAEGETIVRGAQELRAEGVRPDRDRRRRPQRARRDHRGDRGRLRRHAAPAACAAARSPRTATTAWRCSAPSPAWPRARASRSTAWRPPPSPTRRSPTDLGSAAEGLRLLGRLARASARAIPPSSRPQRRGSRSSIADRQPDPRRRPATSRTAARAEGRGGRAGQREGDRRQPDRHQPVQRCRHGRAGRPARAPASAWPRSGCPRR